MSTAFDAETARWTVLDEGSTGIDGGVCWGVMGLLEGRQIVVFGGHASEEIAVGTRNDSVVVASYSSPVSSYSSSSSSLSTFTPLASTEFQPTRKIYSASSTSNDGSTMFISGGAKDDGSGIGYSQVWAVGFNGAKTSSPSPSPSYSSSADFNPSSIKFTSLPPLPVFLIHHQSLVLANGSLLILGGYNTVTRSFLNLSTGLILDDPTSASAPEWRTVMLSGSPEGAAPAGRRGHSVVLLTGSRERRDGGDGGGGETALLFGGTSSAFDLGGSVLGDLWALDLMTGRWKQLDDGTSTSTGTAADTLRPQSRMDASAVSVGDQMIIYGGYGPSTSTPSNLDEENRVYIYDHALQAWTSRFIPLSAHSSYSSSSSNPSRTESSIYTTTLTQHTRVATRITVVPITTTNPDGETITSLSTRVETYTSPPYTSADYEPGTGSLSSKQKTAITLGILFGLLAILAFLILFLLFLKRRRRRERATSQALWEFKPYQRQSEGARIPNRSKSSPHRRGYSIRGEGAQALIPQRMFADEAINEKCLEDEEYESPCGESNDRNENRDRKQEQGRTSPVQYPICARRNSGRIDMFAHEDDSAVNLVRRQVSTGTADTKMTGSSIASDEYEKQADLPPAVPSKPTKRKGTPQFELESPFDDPLDNYANFVSGIEDRKASGSGSAGANSSLESNSLRSTRQATVEAARKISINRGNASYVDINANVKRRQSLLRRIAESANSLFSGGNGSSGPSSRDSSTDREGFLDPTPPLFLSPISDDNEEAQEDNPLPPCSLFGSSPHPNFAGSMTSVHSGISEAFEQYSRMNIIQRARTASSESEGVLSDNSPFPPSSLIKSEPAIPKAPRAVPIRSDPLSTFTQQKQQTRRHVKEMAASINRRAYSCENPALFRPSPLEAAIATSAVHPSPMQSPSRGIDPQTPRAIRRPKTLYELSPRSDLKIANL